MAEIPPGALTPPSESGIPSTLEKNPQLEAALANRLIGRGESLNDELISSAETPQQLFYGLRAIEKKLEDGNIPPSLTESYRPPGQLSILFNRAEALKLSNNELQKRGWLKNYNPDTGEGLPTNRKYSSLALGIEEDLVTNEKGEVVSNILGQPETKFVFKYGKEKEKERETLAHAYEKATLELEARAILGEHVGVRLNLAARDSLEDLVNWEHTTTAKFRAGHLHALFNMPDVEELATNPENHTLGDKVEEAMFLNLVMLNSGGKQQMLKFLERPGAKHLIAKLAKERDLTYDQWVHENVGDVKSWEDDGTRRLVDEGEKEASWRIEAADHNHKRGSLTKWSNIAAWGGKHGEFDADKETDFIEGTVGGLVGSVEASWVAASVMKATGTYASEGYVALPNGESNLPLGEGRFITGDDSGKFWAYMFNIKEGKKGRSSGLKDMIGKIPDLAMNLFDWCQVEVSDLKKNPDGTPAKRSIWDAWLGTVGGKAKKDLLTGKETTEKTTEEPYHPLGKIEFGSAERDFHGTFGIMQWLTGRDKAGVFTEAMKVDFGFEEFTLNELKKKNKFIGIVMNPVILTKGSTQLYTNSSEASKIIAKNFLRNLMSARIHSVHFNQAILPAIQPIYHSKLQKNVEVPQAKLVELFVNEAIKDTPKTEEELIRHYIDENYILRDVGTNMSGVADVVKNAKFETNVGRVTGRKA